MKSWSALQGLMLTMCEFLNSNFFFVNFIHDSHKLALWLRSFSQGCQWFWLGPLFCLIKVSSSLLQVPAHSGGVRLHGRGAEAGPDRWKTKPSSHLSSILLFQRRKTWATFSGFASCIFLSTKAKNPSKRVIFSNSFPGLIWLIFNPCSLVLSIFVLTDKEMPAIRGH